MRAAAVACLLLAAPAAAADLCGNVEVLGVPLPHGFVSLEPDAKPWAGTDAGGGNVPMPGRAGVAMLRVRDGVFCWKGAGPGNYRLEVSPLGVPGRPLPFLYEGERDPSVHRLTMGAAGPALFDAGGAGVAKALNVVVTAPEPAGDWTPVEAVLIPPPGSEGEKEPILVVMTAIVDRMHAYTFVRENGPWPKTGRTVSARLPPGRLREFRVMSPRWAIARMDPPLAGMPDLSSPTGRASAVSSGSEACGVGQEGIAMGGCDSPDLSRGGVYRLRVALGPAAGLSGRVTTPGGKPFRPGPGPGGAPFQVQLTAETLAADYRTSTFADSEGVFEFTDLTAGPRTVVPTAIGDAFPWRTRRARIEWVGGTRPQSSDEPLEAAWAEVFVDEATAGAQPDTAVYGFAPGALDARAASSLLFDSEAPFSFQRREGTWRPDNVVTTSTRAPTIRVAPGPYEAILVERGPVFATPWVRVLATERMTFAAGELRAPAFAARRRSGTASAAARVSPWRVDPASLRDSYSITSLHGAVAPRLAVFDVRGDFVGAAFAPVSHETLKEFAGFLDAGKAEQAAALFGGESVDLEVPGLAPGDYRLRLEVPGREAVERRVTVSAGSVARVEEGTR